MNDTVPALPAVPALPGGNAGPEGEGEPRPPQETVPGPGLEIAAATVQEIAGIQLAAAEAWRATYRSIYPPDLIEALIGRTYSAGNLRRILRTPGECLAVVRDEGEVAGFCHVGPGRHGGELYRLSLRPAWWGSHAGGLLLAHLEAWLQQEGYLGYVCHVHRMNDAARRFYEEHGFRHLAEYDEGDNLFLWKDLG